MWASILIASFGTYAEKLIGYMLPHHMLERESIRRMTGLLPVSLLAALVAVQTFAINQTLVIDARVLGLAVAVVALLLRAPFLVVIIAAAASTAIVRWLGWLP
jgi:branched-subunit amino acid transport protein